ncbi:MAG: FIG01121053: hypothetical protein, partial [uncultured Nocardioides sp.]
EERTREPPGVAAGHGAAGDRVLRGAQHERADGDGQRRLRGVADTGALDPVVVRVDPRRPVGPAGGHRHHRRGPRRPVGHRVPARRLRPGHRARHRAGAARARRRQRPGGRPHRLRRPRGRGRPHGRGAVPRLRPGPARLLLPHDGRGQPHRAGDVRRLRDRRRGADPHRHPEGLHPRRRAPGLRPRRLPLRLHRRDRRARPGAGPRLAGRQGAADHGRRRACAGEPRRHARVHVGPPQRAGARLRRHRPAVGQRVRRQHVRRAQPDRAGHQLRLARGGGARGVRRHRVHRPAGRVAHQRGVPVRAGVPRRVAVAGRAARHPAVAGPGRRRAGRSAARLLRRRLRPPAHRRHRPRRDAVGHHVQPRRARRAGSPGRPDPPSDAV